MSSELGAPATAAAATAAPPYSSIPIGTFSDSNHQQQPPARTLLLFVHGFLGSESSFSTFPTELAQSLRLRHGLRGLECRMLPTFDSKGNITRAVHHLCNWLMMNASYPEYGSVVILAHSMGGLLAVDAYRKLYDIDKDYDAAQNAAAEAKKEPETHGETPRADGEPVALVWANDHDQETSKESALQVGKPLKRLDRLHVNVVSIVAFDSPFFGVNSSVYTTGVTSRAKSIITPYIPSPSATPAVSSTVPATTESSSSSSSEPATAAAAPTTDAKTTTPPPKPGSLSTPSASVLSLASLMSLPSAALQTAGSAMQTASTAVAALPGVMYESAKTTTQIVTNLPSTATTLVSNLPTAAYESAKTASTVVSNLPSTATSTAVAATNLAVDSAKAATNIAVDSAKAATTLASSSVEYAYNTAVAATSSAIQTTVAATSVAYQYTASSPVAGMVAKQAYNALPGVALAGAAAALTVVPGTLGLAAAIIPRFTWGRMAIAGVGAVVAASAFSGKKDETTDTSKPVDKTGEETKGKKPDTAEGEQVGAGVDATSSESKTDQEVPSDPSPVDLLSALEGTESKPPAATLEKTESDPSLVFLTDSMPESAAETAGLETALLIGAAALADSMRTAAAAAEAKQKEVSTSDEIQSDSPDSQTVAPAGIQDSSLEVTNAIEATAKVDEEIGGLLRRVSMSLSLSRRPHLDDDAEVPQSSPQKESPEPILEEQEPTKDLSPKAGPVEGGDSVQPAAEVSTEAAPEGSSKPDEEPSPQDETKGDSEAPAEDNKQLALVPKSPEETTTVAVSTSTATTVTTTNEASRSSWAPWLTLGVAGATVAAGAYYSGGLSLAAPLVQRLAVAWAIGHASEASKHLQFLYPLWGERQVDWQKRVEIIKFEVEREHLAFQCFYIEIPVSEAEKLDKEKEAAEASNKGKEPEKQTTTPEAASSSSDAVVPAETNQPEEQLPAYQEEAAPVEINASTPSKSTETKKPAEASKNTKPAQPPQPRTFIAPPPASAHHLFRSVPCDSDEICGHMTMFDRSENASAYWLLVDESANVIAQALKRWKARQAAGEPEGEMKQVLVDILPL